MEYTKSDVELMKGKIFLAKVYASLSYVLAAGAAVGAVVSDIPGAYLVLTAFGTAAAVGNGLSAERLESRVQAQAAGELEAKLKAKRESERLEDMAILSKRCEHKDKYM